VTIAVVWNILVCNADMKDDIAYKIVKTLLRKRTNWWPCTRRRRISSSMLSRRAPAALPSGCRQVF